MQPDGVESDIAWKMLPSQKVKLKGDQEELEIIVIALDTGGALSGGFKIPLGGGDVLTGWLAAAEGRAKRGFEALKKWHNFNPKRYPFEPTPESFTKESYPQKI
jgi:hypothetical protein